MILTRIFRVLKTTLKMAILRLIVAFDRIRASANPLVQNRLTPGSWGVGIGSEGHLMIQDCDVVGLAERYGTPLYIVDKMRLEGTYRAFHSSFAKRYPRVEVAYSYKTNPLPGVIKVLHELGSSAEVISEFELWLALRLGVSPDKIIYNGPAKTRKALELAVSRGIKLINIDNISEIDVIDELAGEYRVRQQVGVRVVTSVGWSSQFGLSIKRGQAYDAFQRIVTKNNLVACGIHIHLGTGIQNVGTYLQAIKEVLEFGELLRNGLSVEIGYLDFGGGFGAPTVRSFSEIDVKLMQNNLPPRMTKSSQIVALDDYAAAIGDLVSQYYPRGHKQDPIIILEPGRAITSSAQSLLLGVLTVKPGVGEIDSVILDGGKNITMPLGYEYHEMFVASKMNEPLTRYYNLFGPLCHPGDIVFKGKKLPTLESGDIIAVMDAGAYFVPNQMNFSNPRPAAVMVESGRDELIRRREIFEDIILCDVG